jgi:hypothetical protein
MVAVRFIDRAELEKRLAPYKCRLIQAHASGLEIWETGWSEPFTLWCENGRYEEWAYFKLLADVIGPTMPATWNGTP